MVIFGLFVLGLLGYALVSRVLDRWSLTPHIVLLTLGIAAGLLVAEPETLGFDTELLHGAGELALILALFVDAARIDVGALRGTAALPVRLLAIGFPLTLVLGLAAALVLLPGLTLVEALLLAALVAPTDASLGAIVVISPRVPLRVRQALNVESGLNDGLVTPIVVVAAAIAAAATPAEEGGLLRTAVTQVLSGTLAGILVGAGGALLFRIADRRGLILPAARWIAAPAMALLALFVAHEIDGNAFVAAFVGGLAYAATIGRAQDEDLEVGEVGGELLALLTFFLFGVLVPSIGGYDVRRHRLRPARADAGSDPAGRAGAPRDRSVATERPLHGLVRTTGPCVHRARDRRDRGWRRLTQLRPRRRIGGGRDGRAERVRARPDRRTGRSRLCEGGRAAAARCPRAWIRHRGAAAPRGGQCVPRPEARTGTGGR